MQKWEYLIAYAAGGTITMVNEVPVKHRPRKEFLAEYGDEGWELTSITYSPADRHSVLYFKRPKQ
jgi:hypothetical protein